MTKKKTKVSKFLESHKDLPKDVVNFILSQEKDLRSKEENNKFLQTYYENGFKQGYEVGLSSINLDDPFIKMLLEYHKSNQSKIDSLEQEIQSLNSSLYDR